MVGALLRSGSVKRFLPLGATGNPVYRAASQLRAAMRRQLGPGQDLADFFAIPKQDEKGESIDWYSPFEGNVVPWTAATPEERAEAKSKLLAAQRQLQQMSETFSAAEDSERQVFGRLLALATRIPGEDHVYLVNGRPVMTFWGFSERDTASDRDVLAGLDTGPGYPQTPSLTEAESEGAATTAVRSRWWSWPWLLLPLLLLLLALLLFGLRRCAPEWMPQIELIAPVHKEEPAPAEEKEPPEEGRKPEERSDQTESHDLNRGSLEKRSGDGRTVVGDVDRDGVVRRSGTTSGEFDSTSRSTDDAVDSDRQDTESADTADRTDTNADVSGESTEDRQDQNRAEESADTAATDEKAKTTGEDDGKAGEKGDQGEADRGRRDSTADQDRGREKASQDADVKSQSDAAGKNRDNGAPLVIPRDAAKKGSTDFMNGNWRSVTGLQDAAGNPVQLEYEFKGGEGTAKLRRTVGGKEQECTAAVHPSFKGSRLVIDQAEDIRCPDGSTFQRSSVECTTNPQGRAECKGKNVDGSDYQVRINKK